MDAALTTTSKPKNKKFAVAVIATLVILGALAAFGIQQAQVQSSSPFQINSSGAISEDWSRCALRLDDHTCQLSSGTVWSFNVAHMTETFTTTVPLVSLYLKNITSYTQVIQPCNFNASGVGPAPYYVPQWYVNQLYQSLNSLQSQAASAKSSDAYNSATQQIYVLEQTIQSTCAPQALGAYKNAQLTVAIGIINDPISGVPLVGNALDPHYNTTATSEVAGWLPLKPSDRQVSVTITLTYDQATITRNGQLYQTINYGQDVKTVSWVPAS